jgi:hypothetical protein
VGERAAFLQTQVQALRQMALHEQQRAEKAEVHSLLRLHLRLHLSLVASLPSPMLLLLHSHDIFPRRPRLDCQP